MNEYFPVALAGALVAATYAHRRLMRAAQPLRLQLAEKGELLLANPKVPKRHRRFVNAMLDSAFSNYMFLIFATCCIPIVAVLLIFDPDRVISKIKELSAADAEVRTAIADLSKLHDRITFYNHPLLMLFIEFELLIAIPVAVLLSGLIHGSAPPRANRDEVLELIEAKEHERFAPRRAA
jgi:hypothetical protein